MVNAIGLNLAILFFILVGGAFLQNSLIGLYLLKANVRPEEAIDLLDRIKVSNQYFKGLESQTQRINFLANDSWVGWLLRSFFPFLITLSSLLILVSFIANSTTLVEWVCGGINLLISTLYLLAIGYTWFELKKMYLLLRK